jgi:type III secretory pathway component EscV
VSKAELNTLLSAKVDYSQYRGDLTHQLSKQQLLEGMSEVTDKYEAVMKKIDQLHEEFTNFKFNESFSHAIDNRISVSDLKQAL